MFQPRVGNSVRLRGRRWLVEGKQDLGAELLALRLACIDDDARGETTDIVWQYLVLADASGCNIASADDLLLDKTDKDKLLSQVLWFADTVEAFHVGTGH